MPKAPRLESTQPLATDLPRPFQRAAISSRFIGLAAMTLGGLAIASMRRLPAGTAPAFLIAYLMFALMFLVPGLLYLVLAGWISRRRRWAIRLTFALASVDMTLLGIVIVLFASKTREGIFICTLCGLFVVALAVLTTLLGRSLDVLKRLEGT